MGLNYQSLYKMVERPDDGFFELVQVRNNSPYLVFSGSSYFTETHLRDMHRNLRHPSREKQMKVIEDANVNKTP